MFTVARSKNGHLLRNIHAAYHSGNGKKIILSEGCWDGGQLNAT